jgi:hypothetical protein
MDYTKDHKNRVNSLLMERWGYGKKTEEKELKEDESMYNPFHPDYQDPQLAQRRIDQKKGRVRKKSGEVDPEQTAAEQARRAAESEELEEMQGHPGKCCDMAHPDDPSPEGHKAYMARITMRLGETNGEDKTPKNVEAFLGRLERLKTMISTIDDPVEVFKTMLGIMDLIIENNPTDFTDGEKRRVYLQLRNLYRDESRKVGKEKAGVDKSGY